ncbi:hypothetical protein Q5E69_019270 (plasmid) [Acinetobacter baumannii]
MNEKEIQDFHITQEQSLQHDVGVELDRYSGVTNMKLLFGEDVISSDFEGLQSLS